MVDKILLNLEQGPAGQPPSLARRRCLRSVVRQQNKPMRRLPLLLISAFLLTIAGAIVYFWFAFATAPIQQQQAFTQNMTQSSFAILPLIFLGAMILGFIIWIWALIHMLTNQRIQGTDKIVWAIVIVFLSVLGAILYFLVSPIVRPYQREPQR